MVQSRTQFEVVEEIMEAVEAGRGVVPLIGAGFSVESGIPALAGITQYLAKVQCYVTRSVFSPGAFRREAKRVSPASYQDDPSPYLRDFGWPDPNRVNAELWAWLDHGHPDESEFRTLLERQVQLEFLEDLSRLDPGLAKILRSTSDPFGLRLQGNWKTLLAFLTHANPDYIDALFQRLVRGRQPGTAHRFLAFLSPVLELRVFLTVNFDNLLEEALRMEGLRPTVYEVSHDSPLPHPSLVQEELSVVKLHGGAFGLRVGDELDYPLNEDSKKRLQDYLPPDPLLLVMGVGGSDRRVMDFVELVVRRHAPGQAAVYWLHFEPVCPPPVANLAAKLGQTAGTIFAARTHSLGVFLQELFYRYTGSHPASKHPYNPYAGRPIDPDVPPSRSEDSSVDQRPAPAERPVHIFLDDLGDFSLGASLRLARFVSRKAATHTPIWIDLEAMHGVAEVAVEVIRQIRNYDRMLPPLVLPTGPAPDDVDAVGKAVRRIYEALSRGRYILAFNAVGSFGRPPTFHHGTPGQGGDREAMRMEFLWALVRAAHRSREGEWSSPDPTTQGPLRDSILALSLDPIASRSSQEEEMPELYPLVWGFASPLVEWHRPKEPSRVALDGLEAREDFDALLVVAAFRRRRSIVALRSLLPPYLPKENSDREVEKILRRFESEGFLKRVDGGYYWMSRRFRDHVYGLAQVGIRAVALLQALTARSGGEEKVDPGTLDRLSRLSAIHEEIAGYYFDLFAASQESNALLEHLYHRISSLRYLTKIDVWLPGDDRPIVPLAAREKHVRRLNERIVHPDGSLQRESLRELRLQRLRAIRRVLEREWDLLLSKVASDTMVGWIDWILVGDLHRFQVATCLASAGETPELPSASKRGAGLEGAISQECREIRLLLFELKGQALRNKMDFRGWTALLAEQLGDCAGPPFAADCPLWMRLVEQGGGANQRDRNGFRQQIRDLSTAVRDREPLERRRAARYLCYLWECLRGSGEMESAATVRDLVAALVERDVQAVTWDPPAEALRLRYLRHEADHHLVGLSPWNLRTSETAEREAVSRLCHYVLRICREALEALEGTSGQTYVREHSYFRSLRGRAHYLIGDLVQARREIGLSQLGLSQDLGANGEPLTIGLLRQAECLMVQADHEVTMVRPEEGREPGGQSRATLARTVARRRLYRAEDTLERAAAVLIDSRRNVEWWACLYQLTAQLEVERLLLQISEPYIEREGPLKKRRFVDEFSQRAQAGLRAIRQGLDVVLVGEGGISPQGNFRIYRFLRIWIELMTCGAFLTRRVQPDMTEEDLWRRWESMNRSCGLKAFTKARAFVRDLDQRSAPKKYEAGLPARAAALRWIKQCVEAKSPEALLQILVRSSNREVAVGSAMPRTPVLVVSRS